MDTIKTKPSMAYPTFANPTTVFAPLTYPVVKGTIVEHKVYDALGRLASGEIIRQSSTIIERHFLLTYQGLTAAEKDSFIADSGEGFFYDVHGELFEYKHTDGKIYEVEFISTNVAATLSDSQRFDLSLIELSSFS